ncbi:bactofilin family protein [Providencia burhodogranariea]|uniref:Integral membrane protein CcmA involved in cell shape determination n=1 Tax=Providencia burhodogranariea DSM 19968 TaxID=1141662 RepID=K8W4H3_9GAMM|nr:polymer-forming cytoskeletal protein [Providencia burhodogranariea]EKT55399.1 Integral membrane protein CcmA involved in cell shape determination [Providencia burhodogranariea DSM 19968]
MELEKNDAAIAKKEAILSKEEKLTPLSNTHKTTSISNSCNISGDFILDDDINVFGYIKGSIRSNNGKVTIEKEGVIEGEIHAQTISINGKVQGLCVSENLDILENGQLDGICQTKNLTIKKGGIFTGSSERTDKKIQPNDVKKELTQKKTEITKLETSSISVK